MGFWPERPIIAPLMPGVPSSPVITPKYGDPAKPLQSSLVQPNTEV